MGRNRKKGNRKKKRKNDNRNTVESKKKAASSIQATAEAVVESPENEQQTQRQDEMGAPEENETLINQLNNLEDSHPSGAVEEAETTTQAAATLTEEEILKERKKQEEAEIIRRIMQKRDNDRMMGIQAMRKFEFDKARVHFENYMNFSNTDSPETVLHVLQNLIVCRLQGKNIRDNLARCVTDCDTVLRKTPEDISIHLAKINALVRMLDFKEAGDCIRKAIEIDQNQHLELLHSFLFSLSEKTTKLPYKTLSHQLNWCISKNDLKDTYASLTLPSCQNLFTFTWDQLHNAIDSPLCTDMIPPGCRANIQQFLHKCLDYNILADNVECQLYFLKQELGCLLAQTAWNYFALPEERPETRISLDKFFSLTESNANSQNMSILAENGMYFAHEGSDFVSSACIDSISHMTHTLGLNKSDDRNQLFVNVNQLYDVGFELMHFLSTHTHSDYRVLMKTDSIAALATEEDWDRFAGFRLRWHERLDIRAVETLTPPKDNDDPKYFESRLEEVLGKEKTKELLQIEFEASKPILEKYAEIISEISGIDQEIILAELTEEEENEEEQTTENVTVEENEENKKEKYEPMGISLLVQSTQFDLKPSDSEENTYDKQAILTKLKALEKDVVQFQINYKKIVFKEAGEQAKDLEKVMSNISLKGLELTKWLRGFVHYMLERRDIEQELLDYCGAEDAAGWSAWFENLNVNMSAAQSILLCLIARLFISNVVSVYLEFEGDEIKQANITEEPLVIPEEDTVPVVTDQVDNEEVPTESVPSPVIEDVIEQDTTTTSSVKKSAQMEDEEKDEVNTFLDELMNPILNSKTEFIPPHCLEIPRFRPSAGHRIERVEEQHNNIRLVNEISQPLMGGLGKIKKALQPEEVDDAINRLLGESLEEHAELQEKIETFKNRLGVDQLIIPCVTVQLPVSYILKFLGTGYNYHKDTNQDLTPYPGANEDLRVMSLMLDRTSTSQETLFHLVYSSVDRKILGFPTRRSMGVPNMFLCQHCQKLFGTLHCQKCKVAHYCSKGCQVAKWDKHKADCKRWKEMSKRISNFNI